MKSDQVPARFSDVFDEQMDIYLEGRTIENRRKIPDTTDIPLDDKRRWLKIENVTCVFVDMVNSTGLSAMTEDSKTAGAYQLFSDTAVRLFDKFEAPYIDLKGDGVFALFDFDQSYRALAAAVTFRTFVGQVFVRRLKEDTNVELGVRAGIDRKTVLVKRLGLRRYGDRTDRQNEVWAGKPVNMAAKLAGLAKSGDLVVSKRFYATVPDQHARFSCGCPDGKVVDLWSEIDTSGDPHFDFDVAYRLSSTWCKIHGAEFCEKFLRLD